MISHTTRIPGFSTRLGGLTFDFLRRQAMQAVLTQRRLGAPRSAAMGIDSCDRLDSMFVGGAFSADDHSHVL
jgi:hypothetical protein